MNIALFFDFFAVGSLIIALLSWVVFAITTMRKIDNSIVKKGKPRPCQWDPMFFRALLYAWPTALPEKIFNEFDDRIVNTEDVKSVVNAFDKIIASLILIGSFNIVLITVFDWFI